MNIGSRVKFVKKVSETDIPLGTVGILCDISETVFDPNKDEELTHYVVFNSIGNADWFNINELEYVGEWDE